MPKLAVLMTTYNRAATTSKCLERLASQVERRPYDWDCQLFLADDGSDDGTREVVAASWPYELVILQGDGQWFWAAGMFVAQAAAMSQECDAYLLLNDDVELNESALEVALAALEEPGVEVVVGACFDPRTGDTSYSGLRRVGSRPTALRMVVPGMCLSTVDTFHGNFVLISHSAMQAVGGLDGKFEHGYGDIDLGLRLCAAGFTPQLLPGYVGMCTTNSVSGTWRDHRIRRRARMRLLLDRKAMPIYSQTRFVRRHGGSFWPFYLIMSYLSPVISILLKRERAEVKQL